jgi:hypothetical protein
MDHTLTYVAFIGDRLLATGPVDTMLRAVKERFDRDPSTLFLIFEEETGRPVDFAPDAGEAPHRARQA